MAEQLLFFETSQAPILRCNLFLAIFPDHRTAQKIAEFGNAFRQSHSLRGAVLPADRLHVSLCHLGNVAAVPNALPIIVGQKFKTIAAQVHPFAIGFTRALSFRGRLGNRPLVLADYAQENDDVRRLHGLLHAKLTNRVPTTSSSQKFSPHMTLLYDAQSLAPEPVEPLHWAVAEIVLVCSEVGKTKYTQVGSWKLGV